MRAPAKSVVALLSLVLILGLLAALDRTRGGPATPLTRCNILLARDDRPAADVLVVGSSRSGVALDPVGLQDLLSGEVPGDPTVERLALGNITPRLAHALLETYIAERGMPKVITLETVFIMPRTVNRLSAVAGGKPSEHYLLARDANVMSFGQLISQPAVAMPYTEDEDMATLWQVRLRGVVLRAGALLYQFAKAPFEDWRFGACDRETITREENWTSEFAFTYGDHSFAGPIAVERDRLVAELDDAAVGRALKDWQQNTPAGRTYPFDFEASYRQGELNYFLDMARMATDGGARVLVLPMLLYGYEADPADMSALAAALPEGSVIFDIYAATGTDFSRFWWDDAHVEREPAGALMTTVLAARLVDELNEAGAE